MCVGVYVCVGRVRCKPSIYQVNFEERIMIGGEGRRLGRVIFLIKYYVGDLEGHRRLRSVLKFM